jgi:hypothetical protein
LSKLVAALVALSLIPAPRAAGQARPAHAGGDAVERRVEEMLARMTLEEKIDLLGGVDDFFVRASERAGLPRLKMADGPNGVRNFGPSTAMPSGVAMAATWNPRLVERVAAEIGRDARAKGVHFLLGPGVNIYRSPLNGRNFEYFGEDPFLAARVAVVVAVGFDHTMEAEGADRTFRLPAGQDELIREVAAANRNTVVVLTSGGGVDMNGWLGRVPALIQAWYPGQEGGTALAEILFGDVNPSGHLPATFERRWEDNPTYGSYYPPAGTTRVEYKEGVFVGYRGYEKNNVRPLFPFGHGLSYTTFRYSNLSVSRVAGGGEGAAGRLAFQVSFDLTNTGARAGAEVAQVYVGDLSPAAPRPSKELKGFAKVSLRPGETRRVTAALDGRAFAYYDTGARAWRVDAGEYQVSVGGSSAQAELRGKVTLTPAEATTLR